LNPRTSYPVTFLAGRPDRPDSGTSPGQASIEAVENLQKWPLDDRVGGG